MKKLIPIISLVFAVMLAGCTATPETPATAPIESAQTVPEAVTLFDTSTVKIVLAGTETTITDKTTGTEYSYTTTRKFTTQQPTLEQMQACCIARTSANTDSVKIELAGALIVVTDKATGQVYYIDP